MFTIENFEKVEIKQKSPKIITAQVVSGAFHFSHFAVSDGWHRGPGGVYYVHT